MNSKPTVLIAGITGILGSKIALTILEKGVMNVKGLIRSHNISDKKQQQLDDLKAKGVVFVEGDLFDQQSLTEACREVEIIVSAIKGSSSHETNLYREDIVLSGQLNLLEAAINNNVKKFVPSDYSVDYFKLDLGDNYNLDFRIKFAELLKQSGLEYTFILNGAFTEVQLSPFAKLFDFEVGTFSYWGDGEQPCDFTTYDDTAKYIAEAIADPQMVNSALKVAGDILTMKQLLATFEEVKGKKLVEKRLGSVDDLKAWIAKTKQKAFCPLEYIPEQYHYTMVSGKGKLDELDNARYPQIKPTTVKQFVSQGNF
ncbi:NmrA family NAD(P)-binding protein [Hassallia byssoidea VB512170]|uniref:NmrA family NAD(P)-binding protein n=1 Tax=Hassallia byssoidea VB512170 TaxID=1304833 RepID=A0A846H5P5_9CYAN|nr:NmrA family NAD(P)-binding protein [Hassalia byssoidea]NEU71911.1 NmrA family NAD(P)-binding protein [Hassalia byssoidea VB512170]